MSLYAAQLAAHDAMRSKFLSEWAPPLEHALNYIAEVVNNVAHAILQFKYIRRCVDTVYPINPINNQRHLMLIPRSVEKFLGQNLFYPLSTLGMWETKDKTIDAVFPMLLGANQLLLNPESIDEVQFEYKLKTIDSGMVNAFATPAGGMVIFTGIVDKLRRSIENRDITEASIDGKMNLYVGDVTLEDAVAALIGHEMTHVASRHSMVGIVVKFLCNIILSIGRFAIIQYLKTTDKEYLKLTQKTNLTSAERDDLAAKEGAYKKLNNLLAVVQDYSEYFGHMFHSRQNEYEADVTGAFFAAQAGYNPKGAIYLQEFLMRHEGEVGGFFHKYFEFIFTHPYSENRKKALYAAIKQFPNSSVV